jgi:mRNA-degrading endonuclease RelE of RelBE toxin-antitoxin system
MNFKLKITPTTKKALKELKSNLRNAKDYKAIKKAISFLGTNPRHPGLQTHLIHSFCGPSGEKVFEAYAQQNTPSAYRIFFYYGPNKNEITIFAIIPHP